MSSFKELYLQGWVKNLPESNQGIKLWIAHLKPEMKFLLMNMLVYYIIQK